MPPIYAIGDIHGYLDQLDRAVALVEADGGAEAEIVFVGDYVDRGPDSCGVIERLASGLAEGRNWTCLKGNHDRLFERFLAKPEPRHDPHLLVGYHWLHDALGGQATIESYGVRMPDRIRQYDLATKVDDAVPEAHKTFLTSLKLKHRVGDLFFAHAGVRPGVPLDAQVENDLLWIRQEFLQDETDHGVLVVHGHTPVDGAPELYANRLGIDTGAGYGRPLVPVVIDRDGIFALSEGGRDRLAERSLT
jgi:serine/threonine protein phosphatase 1